MFSQKYSKIEKIGSGSHGAVFTVTRRSDGATFVVKEIAIWRMSKPEQLLFRNEIKTMANLHHPNIVEFIESFEENGQLLVVMEHCQAGDLAARLHKRFKMEGSFYIEDQILCWFVQLVQAIKYLHSKGILHRDVKPDNIFLQPNGVVKLGDFGVSKVVHEKLCGHDGVPMSQQGTVCGTPGYMAPEMLRHSSYGAQADVWALGCCLYQMCTGEPPYSVSSGMYDYVHQVCDGPIPKLKRSSTSKLRFDLAVEKLLIKDPAQRPTPDAVLQWPWVSKHAAECQLLRRFKPDIPSIPSGDLSDAKPPRMPLSPAGAAAVPSQASGPGQASLRPPLPPAALSPSFGFAGPSPRMALARGSSQPFPVDSASSEDVSDRELSFPFNSPGNRQITSPVVRGLPNAFRRSDSNPGLQGISPAAQLPPRVKYGEWKAVEPRP